MEQTDTDITVRLDGGLLAVRMMLDSPALLTGPAKVAFEGTVNL